MKKNKKIKVIIADDHDLILDGLTLLLGKYPDIQLMDAAKDGKQLMELVKKHRPDVVVTDIRMPVVDGITVIRILSAEEEPIPVIVISTYDDENLIVEAMEAGARGYIIKNAQRGEIIEAIRVVYAGYDHYSPGTSRQLKVALAKSKFNPHKIAAQNLFTAREKEIIRMICQEKESKEIAENLFMSQRTVEGVRTKIKEKMHVTSTIGLILYAVKNGLFNLDDLR